MTLIVLAITIVSWPSPFLLSSYLEHNYSIRLSPAILAACTILECTLIIYAGIIILSRHMQLHAYISD